MAKFKCSLLVSRLVGITVMLASFMILTARPAGAAPYVCPTSGDQPAITVIQQLVLEQQPDGSYSTTFTLTAYCGPSNATSGTPIPNTTFYVSARDESAPPPLIFSVNGTPDTGPGSGGVAVPAPSGSAVVTVSTTPPPGVDLSNPAIQPLGTASQVTAVLGGQVFSVQDLGTILFVANGGLGGFEPIIGSGAPTPELDSIVLFGAGALLLGGLYVTRQRGSRAS